jgi:uncharacterized membrane protein YphA (DoxX/SURF4 family)
MDILFFVGRILLGGYFIIQAYNHLVKSDQLAAYASHKGVPNAKIAVIGSGLLLLLGGYCILAGVRITLGVAALTLFLIPVTFKMHSFWKETGDARMADKVQFMKNMAILGAIWMITMIPTPWIMSWGK